MGPENDHSNPVPEEGDETIDPRIAAKLLTATTRRAGRQIDSWPPYLLVIGAVIFLLAFGAAWLSVRGQHPYSGPSSGALAAMYGGILAWIFVVSVVVGRASRGVQGPSVRQRRYRYGWIAVMVAYSIFQGALYHLGASHAIVYGVYPATVPWLFAGTVFVTIGVIREQFPAIGLGIVLIAVGLVGAFTGPVTAWLVSGVGLGGALAGFAVVRVVQRRS